MNEQMADQVAREQHLERNSEGVEQHPEIRSLHLARFSEGIEQLPEAARKLRRGSFADGFEDVRQRHADPGYRGGGSGRRKSTGRARRGVYTVVATATTVRDRSSQS